MKVKYKKAFLKQVVKLTPKLQQQLVDRLSLFTQDTFHPLLNNHTLSGKYKFCRSINITGDYRAIYTQGIDGTIIFVILGTHPELYG